MTPIQIIDTGRKDSVYEIKNVCYNNGIDSLGRKQSVTLSEGAGTDEVNYDQRFVQEPGRIPG